MRKFKSVFSAVILCVAAAFAVGCAQGDDFNTSRDTAEPKLAEGIVMTTELPEYDKNIGEIKVTITNNSDKEFSFNEQSYSLQKDTGESWRYLNSSVTSINALASVIESGKTGNLTFSVGKDFKMPLSAGKYRLLIGEDAKVCAEFAVK